MQEERTEAGRLRSFQDAVAIITGGASGIGAALGTALARCGAIVILADRQADLATQEAERIRADGGRAEGVALDVRDPAAFAALAESVHLRHGRIDYLFNNAGIGVGGEVQDVPLDKWRDIIEVNMMGVVHGVHAVYPRMVRQGFGHIINTASVAGLLPLPLSTPYSATKHAVVGLSRSLRIEGRLYNVRVSALCPGSIRTPILMGGGRFGYTTLPVPEEAQQRMWERTRPMDPAPFAVHVLRAVQCNQAIIIVPWYWRLAYLLNRISPALVDYVAEQQYRRVRQELEEAVRRAKQV